MNLLRIVHEVERWTGVRSPMLNGYPYMGHPSTIPPSSTWNAALVLMALRLHRMKTRCNRKGVINESPDLLYIEGVFQACVNSLVITEGAEFTRKTDMKARYGKFLHLPLEVENENLLNVAVSHRQHRQGMDSGYHPHHTCFADRIHSTNNMLFETQTSNYLKSDYDEAHYPTVKSVVASIDVPNIYANGDLPISPYDPKLELRSSPLTASHFEDDESDYESEYYYEWKKVDDDEESDSEEEEHARCGNVRMGRVHAGL